MCSLKEVQTWYDLNDLADMHEALDIKEDLEYEAHATSKKKR